MAHERRADRGGHAVDVREQAEEQEVETEISEHAPDTPSKGGRDAGRRIHHHLTTGGSETKIASVLPPVMSPKRVPRS